MDIIRKWQIVVLPPLAEATTVREMDRHRQEDGRPEKVSHDVTLNPTLSDMGIGRTCANLV